MQIGIVLGLLVVAVVLFATEKLSVDIITFILLIVLILSGILSPEEAFSGFSSDYIIILASIFVISGTLTETGVLDEIGSKMVKLVNKRKKLLLINATIVPGIISAFMNNTTVTALFIGPFMSVSKRLGISPSKVLMPLAFSSIIGGTCTLIGTSTNVAVSSALPHYGLDTIGLFEITPIGLILFAVGATYMILIGHLFIPERQKVGATEGEHHREYFSEIYIDSNCSLIGKTLSESGLKKRFEIKKIIRQGNTLELKEDTKIEEEDIYLVIANSDQLVKLKEIRGVVIRSEIKESGGETNTKIRLAEILITPKSSLVKNTIRESDFSSLYKIVVLAIHRMDEELKSKMGDIKLQSGDLLLVQGSTENINKLRDESDFIVLEDFKPRLFLEKKGYITIGIFIAAVLIGSMDVFPLSVSFMIAGLVAVLFGIITPEKAYRYIDWRLLVLIGGMSAFGLAMKKSGASEFLANLIVKVAEPFGVYFILAAFVLLVVILTQPMSNAASALVVLPIAIETAKQLSVSPKSFAIAIMLGASVSFITPLEPASILVYGPGKYKFRDFIIIGFPVTLIMVAIIVALVPFFWPL